MRERQFLRQGRPEWAKLDALSRRLGRLSQREVLEFVSLYRRATSDLARARTLKARGEVVDYLNQLVGRIHFQIYTTPSFTARRFVAFFTSGFPGAVRRNGGYVLAAALMLLLPAAAGFTAVSADPDLIRVFAPPQFADQIERYGTIERSGAGEMSLFTSFYIANNVQVSFFTFVTGIVGGLGSLYFLAVNGAILGAMTAAVGGVGQMRPFLAFVSAHAAIELGAIVLAGAAGLRMGVSLLNPGPLRRRAALAAAGREAGLLMLGVIAMLVVAALIEAWISPSTLPDEAKWCVGALNLGLVLSYFGLAGRGGGVRGPASP